VLVSPDVCEDQVDPPLVVAVIAPLAPTATQFEADGQVML
jgi:hypothetical protein